jgi:SAM-dependent methyltransferase
VAAAFDVVEHIHDDVGALRRMGDALVPGGLLVVTVPANAWLWGPYDELNQHVRRYGRRNLRAALEAAGYHVERTTYFNSFLFPVAAAVRVARRNTTYRRDAAADWVVPPRAVNEALARVFAAERRPLRHVDLPFGVSALALARRS